MSSKTPVEALRKGLEVLEILSNAESAFSLGEIAERMGLKRTTTHNILKTLSMCGFAVNDGEGRYAVGPKMVALTRQLLMAGATNPQLMHLVTDASTTLDEAVVLTAFVAGGRRVLARARGSQLIQVASNALEERDRQLWETVTGRVLAAFCSATELDEIIAAEGYPGSQWNGIKSAVELQQALESIRSDGMAEAHERDLISYAVPIISETEILLGAIGCFLPEFRSYGAKANNILSVLRSTADRLASVWVKGLSIECH